MANSNLTFFSGYFVLTAIFYYLYFQHSPPLSREEIESSLLCKSELNPNSHKNSPENWQICDAFLSKPDTGKEFYAINFIKKRISNEDLYPADFKAEKGCADSVENAEYCYVKRFLPLALKRFSYPIFVGKIDKIPFLVSKALDMSYGDNFEFDQFSVVRYRSIRDFLDLCEEAGRSKLDIAIYKEASIQRHINYFVDPGQTPVITVILTVFWISIIYIAYYIIFWLISCMFC